MFLSVFDIFKIGIGPSSSHTVGPMVAAGRFLDQLRGQGHQRYARIAVSLHGSLAFTGKGHASDQAVILGLLEQKPDSVECDLIDQMIADISKSKQLKPVGLPAIAFDPASDLVFDYDQALPGHSNGMVFRAFDGSGELLDELICYSIGGGFVVSDKELEEGQQAAQPAGLDAMPYPFANAAEMLDMGKTSGLTIAQMKRANECTRMSEAELDAGLDRIWDAMQSCIERGLRESGVLPGGLKVRRRAHEMLEKLRARKGHNKPFEHWVVDWLSVYAMAVNEENAAGGRVVTSPTNGAAGVIPAVLRYYLDHIPDANHDGVRLILLTAAAVGGIIKHNASISGAEVGCQGEVGSASAMAAAGLCAALGGENNQIENAAEIALEHHLGMTCDPIGGLVQVPCIERNAFGAVKAVTAASIALHGDGQHVVSLDSCVETMRQTGLDMHTKYKETSIGGLAANVVEC
ncbi:MAG: L-serine ammonia-lyase [Pseudomonadota bacterium]